MRLATCVAFLTMLPAFSQPPCEAPEAIRKLIASGATKALEQNPDDVFAHTAYQQSKRNTLADRQAMVDRYRDLAQQHAGDPVYAYLYAKALVDTNTPKAIEIATSVAGTLPWAHVLLADVYSSGKFVDAPRARKEMSAFAKACPASLDPHVLSLENRLASPELAAVLAPALRARLERESDLERATAWNTLWALEFKARPVPEHEALRKQVAADVKRLEAMPGERTPAVVAVISNGKKMTGVEETAGQVGSAHTVTVSGDDDWDKQHPRPKPSDGFDKMKEYHKQRLVHIDGMLAKTPNSRQWLSERLNTLSIVEGTTNEQIEKAAEALLAAPRGPGFGTPDELIVARQYVQRGIRLDAVPGLLKGASTRAATQMPGRLPSDRFPDNFSDTDFMIKTQAADIALMLADKTDNAEDARPYIEALKDLKSTQPFMVAQVWRERGRFAELERRKIDALLYYREAVNATGGASSYYTREFDRLWKELGGSAAGKELLAKSAPAPAAKALADGGWQRPEKALPEFQLADLEGKTWKLVSLEGKTVLINLWATWCGPCRDEHPQLQKLYEKIRDRSDLQVITFNVDDEVDKVAPYMKENKYTFPVLLAKSYVEDLMPSLTIPQNWIVGKTGKWQWSQTGYSNGGSFVDEIFKKLTE